MIFKSTFPTRFTIETFQDITLICNRISSLRCLRVIWTRTFSKSNSFWFVAYLHPPHSVHFCFHIPNRDTAIFLGSNTWSYIIWKRSLDLFHHFFGFLPDWLMLSLLKNLTFCGCYHCWNDHLLKYNLESLCPNDSPLSTHWCTLFRDTVQALWCTVSVVALQKFSLFFLCFSKPGYHISFSQLPFI